MELEELLDELTGYWPYFELVYHGGGRNPWEVRNTTEEFGSGLSGNNKSSFEGESPTIVVKKAISILSSEDSDEEEDEE